MNYKKSGDTADFWNKYWGNEKTFTFESMVNVAYPDVVKKLLSLTNQNSRCLEIGCGSGSYSLELAKAGRKIIASDVSLESLKITNKKAKVFGLKLETEIIDVYNILYKEGSFDLIFSDGVMEHLDIPKSLKEQKRVLGEGGWLTFKVPNGNHFLHDMVLKLSHRGRPVPFGWYYLNKKTWRQFMERAGFKNIKIIPCGNLLLSLLRRIFKTKRFNFVPCLGKIYYFIMGQK